MTASRGSPYFQPPTNWITYFQSPFNPSNWGRNSHLIDDFTNNIASGKSLRESKCRIPSTLSGLSNSTIVYTKLMGAAQRFEL